MTALPLLVAFAFATLPSPSLLGAHERVARAASSAEARFLPRIPFPRLRLPGRSRNKVAAPVEAMDRRLRRFVAQEESWFMQHARYGNNVSKVSARDTSRDASLDLVQVQVLFASKRGWTGIASHPEAPGKSCVVYVGYRESLPLIPRTRADAKDAMDEGRPMCDR